MAEKDRTPEQEARDAIKVAAEVLGRVEPNLYVGVAEPVISAWLDAIGLTDAALYHLVAVGDLGDLKNRTRWASAIREVQAR